MTTIRYWITDAPPSVTVTRAAYWFAQTSNRTVPRAMVTARPAAGASPVGASGTASGSLLYLQGIGPGGSLPVRTITGTFRTVLGPSEVFSSTDSYPYVVARVVSADGATVRGTLFAGQAALESGSPSTNYLSRTVSGPITPVAVQPGDRVAIEWGVTRAHSPGTNWPSAAAFDVGADVPFSNDVVLGGTPGYTIWAELILDDPVAPPAGLVQLGATQTSVDIDWSPPATGPAPTSYDMRIDGGAIQTVDPGMVAGGSFLTLYDLSPGTAYLIEVRSRTATGTSAWASLTATTAAPPPPPTAPLITQTAATPTTVSVAWSPGPGTAPTSYDYRLDGGPVIDAGATTSATLGALLPSTTHTVEVRAVNSSGTSAWASLDVTTAAPTGYRPWLVSETLLARAGLDARDDQPAFLWQQPGAAGAWETHAVRSTALIGWQITTGRQSPRDKVPPSVATVTIAAWGDYAAAGLPQLGDRVRLALAPGLSALGITARDRPRFTGEVTDVSLDTRSDVATITAVGRSAREGRRVVDGTGWPVEREGARVGRILAAIGATAGALDVGHLDLLAHPAPAAAQQLLDAVSDSTTGQLVERRDGALDWHAAEHRRDAPVALTLDARELLAGFTWAQRVGDLTNTITVKHGEGESTVTDAASVAARDPYAATLDTLLPTTAHAQAVAGLIVGRYAEPVWLLPAVALDLLRTLDPPDLPTAVALTHGTKLHLSGLPAGGPYTERDVFVEGVTETLTPRAWRLNLTVADEALAGSPLRWRDVPGIRWADVAAGIRWLDVAQITDPADLT